MSAPRVSVIIPCRDGGGWLDEAIASVRAQTFTAWEILVVDDGSRDEATRARFDRWDAPAGARLLRLPRPRGPSAARNAAIREAHGEFLCALDCDDRLVPTWLDRGVAVLDADPAVAIAAHWLRTFGDEAADWKPVRADTCALLDSNPVNGASLVRRAAVLRAGLYDESLHHGEDWNLWIRITRAGGRVAIVPSIEHHYRKHAAAASSRREHADALSALLTLHADAYREHLESLIARREDDLASRRNSLLSLEGEEAGWLSVLARTRSEERDRLHARVEHAIARAQREARLRQRAEELCRRRDALLASWSWRVTAPLRLVGSLFLRGDR